MTQDIHKDTTSAVESLSTTKERFEAFFTMELRVILETCSITPSQEIAVVLASYPEYVIHPPKIIQFG